LHDLVCNTVVQRLSQSVRLEPTKPYHYAIASLAALVPIALSAMVGRTERFAPMLRVRDDILAATHAQKVGINDSRTTLSGGRSTTSLTITVWTDSAVVADSFATFIAKRVLNVMPEAHERDQIAIVIQHGYDIMIWTSTRFVTVVHTPAQWDQAVSSAPPAV
jgi:hypothetical protein